MIVRTISVHVGWPRISGRGSILDTGLKSEMCVVNCGSRGYIRRQGRGSIPKTHEDWQGKVHVNFLRDSQYSAVLVKADAARNVELRTSSAVSVDAASSQQSYEEYMATKKPKETLSARREQLREEHAVAVRERIQVSKLVEALEGFALGKSTTKMTATRLKSIEMLLDKTLPNLASIKHETDAKQVTFMIGSNFVKPE